MAQIYDYRMRQQTATTAQQKTNERNIYIERIVELDKKSGLLYVLMFWVHVCTV